MSPTRRHNAARGFTLVEAIASMVVLSTIGLVSGGLVWSAVDSFSDGSTVTGLHSDTSIAMERVVRAVRSMAPDADGDPDFVSADADSLVWDGGDASLTIDGTNLVLREAGSDRVLLADAAAIAIRVFDNQNLELSLPRSGDACDPIRRVEIAVTASRGGASDTLRTRVFLRCKMLEFLE